MRAPKLFTPGPLNTSDAVRAAAAVDMGSRTPESQVMIRRIQQQLARIVSLPPEVVVVPMQGSGTFAVESMLSSLLAEQDHVLVVENGAYSARMAEICRRYGIRHTVLSMSHEQGLDLARVEQALQRQEGITHIAATHFETALGVRNDIAGLSQLARRCGQKLLLDTISSFGALPLELAHESFAALALSANKCLHGLPGVAFVIVQQAALGRLQRPRTLALDLTEQHRELERSGQWRFTPPLQILRALDVALGEYFEQGAQPGRLARYEQCSTRLMAGMRRIGLELVLDPAHTAPLIYTVKPRAGLALDVAGMESFLAERGLVIYPTKHAHPNTFRVGVIGELHLGDIDALIDAIDAYLRQSSVLPAASETDLSCRV
ncbi:2-aminoethylphosphonate aminotransferase [Roseateles sp. DB2]|uniref:2-aminoethylphosphonate aminotransferase n=1 Tax=Roseateles sp. DB2 TaxID=3453717 RepID=UPI003EE94AE6